MKNLKIIICGGGICRGTGRDSVVAGQSVNLV